MVLQQGLDKELDHDQEHLLPVLLLLSVTMRVPPLLLQLL